MTPNSQRFSMYGFCMLVAAAFVGLFAISIDYFLDYVNNIIIPCQHDSIWQDGHCVCDNTKGIFAGAFCEECQCEHLGICRMSSEGATDTRWSCHCPNHQKWVGTTCDKCYAQLKDDRCHGKCIENHYGSQCHTLCYEGEDTDAAAADCSSIRAAGGTCNTCNGHGTCTGTGECECDAGYFTSRSGQQCSLGCSDCPENNGLCQSIGGQLQCICYPGFFGESCEQTCQSINNFPCSGHGTCQITPETGLQCVCDSHYVGADCSHQCPGNAVLSEACSGHGECQPGPDKTAVCECSDTWTSNDCSCLDEITCNGFGRCSQQSDQLCECIGNYGGTHCERCKEHYFGSNCQLYCDPNGDLSSTDQIGCNGHGNCFLNNDGLQETIECECQSNYESTKRCSACQDNYFPKVNQITDVEHCSIPCSRENECSNKGSCNPDYDGNNFICNCEKNGVDGDFDTLDPEVGCSACKQNWYPKDLDEPATRCTRYCAAEGQTSGNNNTIKFGDDMLLQTDTDAQSVCTAHIDTYGSQTYSVNANCHVCSGSGTCDAEGDCACSDGVTGSYCEIDCGRDGREACSGHGRCIRDELELWFDPNSNNFRCECLPYDTYTAEARQRLVKNGFKVDPPPSADYYGQHCDYHCPTYNSEICAGRGSCSTVVATNAEGQPQKCNSDTDCSNAMYGDKNDTELDDTFCSVLSTPWDSLTPRFFEIGSDSPGYAQCTKTGGASCIDSIYSVDWGDFCVQMLNGWYPNELNTAQCAFEPSYREMTETFFIEKNEDSKTWCERALQDLTPDSNSCTASSHADVNKFETYEFLCFDLTLESSCLNEDHCLYDQTLQYIFATDQSCSLLAADLCTGKCEAGSDGVCRTKTYCRAKTCRDAINEKSIETLCLDLPEPCSAIDGEQMCSSAMYELRTVADEYELSVSSADLFFTCYMADHYQSPLTMQKSTPGNIVIDGTLEVLGRRVPVAEYRAAAVDYRSTTNDNYCEIPDDFCQKHLASVLSDKIWHQKASPGWYNNWRVKCGDYMTLWPSETKANAHRTKVESSSGTKCTVMDFGNNPNEAAIWSLDCLDSSDSSTDSMPEPHKNNCILKENQINARWGQSQWSPHEIEQIFQETCEQMSTSPAIPTVPNVPDYCATHNPCGVNSVCGINSLTHVSCVHKTIVSPVCGQGGIQCSSGNCSSFGTEPNTYTCAVSNIEQYNKNISELVRKHDDYRNIQWLDHCKEAKPTFLSLERKPALWNTDWTNVNVQMVDSTRAHFISATISGEHTIDIVVEEGSGPAMLVVDCGESAERFFGKNTSVHIVMTGTCTFESHGVYIVSSIKVDNELQLDTLSNTISDEDNAADTKFVVTPAILKESLQFGYHPNKLEFGNTGLVTIDKNSNDDTAAAANTAGLKWDFENTENVRISGWLFLSEGSKAEMRLLSSSGQSLVEMSVESDNGLILASGSKEKRWSTEVDWIPWYIEARYINETHSTEEETHVHHQYWRARVSVGEHQLTFDKAHKSLSHTRKTLGRIAPSFHNIPGLSESDCHQQCASHVDCLQWSWTEEDNHCYLYEKRCHEDKRCVHGTHTLHSAHSHHVGAFVMNTYGEMPVTWAHVRHDTIVDDIVDFEATYHPDTTAVCNDLASSFLLLPGYKTRVCNGECGPHYVESDLGKCGEFLKHKEPENCTINANWTAYCYYKKSFDSQEVTVDGTRKYYYPISGKTSTENNIAQICEKPQRLMSDAKSNCSQMSASWFEQCLGRWDIYEEFCDDSCLTSIETQLSASNGSSLCQKRKEYLQLNISKGTDEARDTHCSKNVEQLIVTDFCLLQNAYHNKEQVLIPELYMSDCPREPCASMLSEVFTRPMWRSWCEDLSQGNITGICSRTSCDCNVEEYIGVAGQFCELTCPSGTDNGIEVACSGRNGKCFAEDFNQIEADYIAQETQKSFRGTSKAFVLPLPDYEPIWLAGPTPSATGICQCALGSGDSCSIPCDRCNNGTYGQEMASQYGICDAYYGLCRSLPPFMRYNVKMTTIGGKEAYDVGYVLSYNTTNFEGIEWQNPERFVYATDTVLFEQSMLDMYDYSGESYGIEQELNYDNIGSVREETVLTVLNIFQRLSQHIDWSASIPYMTNSENVQNAGFQLDSDTVTLFTIPIPMFPTNCTKVEMSEWFLCFANGRLHAAVDSTPLPTPMMVIESGNDTLPTSGMTFVRVSDNVVYAFGGSTQFDKFGQPYSIDHNNLYSISLRRQQWDEKWIVLAEWSEISTTGAAPPKQNLAPIHYIYNDLYVVSTSGNEHRLFVLSFTLDETLPKWSSYNIPQTGALVNMIPDKNNNQLLHIYIGGTTITYSKQDGFFRTSSPESVSDISLLYTPTLDETDRHIHCNIRHYNFLVTIGGNVVADFATSPVQVFVFLEEWLNLDVTSNSNIVQRFYNTIEWRVTKTLNLRSIREEVDMSTVIDHVEKLYMQQARWRQGSMLSSKIALYESIDRKDVRLSEPSGEPSDNFLNIISQNDGSLFINGFASSLTVEAIAKGASTMLYVAVEGDKYEQDLVISGHLREFDIAKISYPYTEQLRFQNGVIDIVVNEWSSDKFSVSIQENMESTSKTSWSEESKILTFYIVIHVEEWMYNTGTEFKVREEIAIAKTGWQALLNMVVSEYSEDTHRMKQQLSKYLSYYGSHCSSSADNTCPGTMTYTHMACSGHGRCNAICNCECEVAPSVLQHNDNALDNIDWQDSPYRGDGCEITCPGFDGYDLKSICSGKPTACQRDGTCACDEGRTGDACQFECPYTIDKDTDTKKLTCSRNGGCGTKAVELTSTVFTHKDIYKNRLAGTNRQHYINALLQYYGGECHSENYQQVNAQFDVAQTGHLEEDGQTISYRTRKHAIEKCTDLNDIYSKTKDLTQYESDAVGSCVGVLIQNNRYYPVQKQPVRDIYPNNMVLVHKIFDCTYSDCILVVHEDDRSILSNVEIITDPPTFEFHGTYVHGASSGQIIYNINGKTIFVTIDWTVDNLKITMQEQFNEAIQIVDKKGAYKQFSLYLGNSRFLSATVTVKLYNEIDYTLTADNSIWLAPQYGQKYRQAKFEQGGYVFTPFSTDTREDMKINQRHEAEYECDIEENCIGIVQWKSLSSGTLFSLYTLKSSIGSSKMYNIDGRESFDFYSKMSLFYKGKNNDIATVCAPVVSRQTNYPMVQFTTEYDIPISNVDLAAVRDEEEPEALKIGNGIWTNCWDKIEATGKTDCMNKCKQKGNHGFAFTDTGPVCLCYDIAADDIQLHKYYSDTAKTNFNPCDTNRRNNPKTVWRNI